jgi:histidinol dehydrogenase
VLSIIDWRQENLSPEWLNRNVPRVSSAESSVDAAVSELIEDVRNRGSQALLDQSERFDGCRPEGIRTPRESLTQSLKQLDHDLRSSIEIGIDRVRRASEAQVPPPATIRLSPGALVTQRWQPVDRAGVYIPGGKAVYPSSVVMNVVAAQVAGVKEIVLVSPPQAEWGAEIHPTILATAELLGVTEVYRIGGAGAIGALAYGVNDAGLEPVSVITGPGNIFVATAKRLVKGVVGIDSEAGPTEIVVIADGTTPADFVASDLVSQAEHDEMAQAVLVTTDADYAQRVVAMVEKRASQTAHRERVNTSLSGPQSAVILVKTLDDAIAVSDALAPEHLEICTAHADAVAKRITHVGAIFLGSYTPVSAGDYLAGSNHVLPTGGQAKFQSGLSAMTFLRPQQIVEYSREALAEVADDIVRFANAEDLPAHGEAVAARFEAGED